MPGAFVSRRKIDDVEKIQKYAKALGAFKRTVLRKIHGSVRVDDGCRKSWNDEL